MPDATILQIRNELERGTPQSQIVKTVGVYNSIVNWLLKHNIVNVNQ